MCFARLIAHLIFNPGHVISPHNISQLEIISSLKLCEEELEADYREGYIQKTL